MKFFRFVDRLGEQGSDSLTAYFTLRPEEEFLQDHFKHFPVMPGVLLLETLKQTASCFLALSSDKNVYYQLVKAQGIRFGYFVRPGTQLKMTVRVAGRQGSEVSFDGRIDVINGSEEKILGKALSAHFSLLPMPEKEALKSKAQNYYEETIVGK